MTDSDDELAELDELERLGAQIEKVYETFPRRPDEDPDDYRDRIGAAVLAGGSFGNERT